MYHRRSEFQHARHHQTYVNGLNMAVAGSM
ncbi:hypothetical protein F5I99_09205 [Nitrincola iocasae]|uniref:Uncharacterized protein n=1 Tax=Nitrincola iocasae TaxID=2614693 RepID=A0A5J6LE00_9GAMM|nr:hypothetical protein F5I99_09205 [Nitrincola iocasae]